MSLMGISELNSKIFEREEATNYYIRNQGHKNRFIAEQILALFPKKVLERFAVAEFGIGTGTNLMLLSNYVRCVHGYDIAEEAVANFQKMSDCLGHDRAFARCINVCEDFCSPIRYDLVLYGWFAYYVSEIELQMVKKNLLNNLNAGGYVFVHDFLVRENRVKPDRHNQKLSVYKRNLRFWIDHFCEFDLIDFRLFQCERYFEYQKCDNLQTIDVELTDNDDLWIFNGLFRHRI